MIQLLSSRRGSVARGGPNIPRPNPIRGYYGKLTPLTRVVPNAFTRKLGNRIDLGLQAPLASSQEGFALLLSGVQPGARVQIRPMRGYKQPGEPWRTLPLKTSQLTKDSPPQFLVLSPEEAKKLGIESPEPSTDKYSHRYPNGSYEIRQVVNGLPSRVVGLYLEGRPARESFKDGYTRDLNGKVDRTFIGVRPFEGSFKYEPVRE